MNVEKLTKQRWLVLAASCLVNLCIGALYAWSVFAGPMAAHLTEITRTNITAADLAIVFSIGNGFGFITMIAGGFLNQKIGPKWVIFIGGVLFGLGFIISGLARSISMLIIGFGLFSGLAMGLAYGCTISNSVKFFPDKAGLVGGIATAAYGISSVILPPLANALISSFGVSKAFLILGIAIIVIVAVSSQFIIKCPDGFIPEGYTPPAKDKGESEVEGKSMNWKEMLSSSIFYVMIIMLFFGAVQGMMAISQASNIFQNLVGMSVGSAAIVVSVLALFNTFGRIVCGSISDRIGCINTLTGVFILSVIAVGLLYLNGGNSQAVFIIGICLVGICFGAFMGVYPSFTADQFGAKYSSVNYGIMFIGFNAAGLIGPMIVSSLLESTGTYRTSFFVAMILAVIGLGLSFLYRALNKNFKRA